MSYNFSGAEWLEWKINPQTKEFLRLVRESRQDIQDSWGNREYTTADPMTTVQLNAGALGSVDALQQIIAAIENIGVEQ